MVARRLPAADAGPKPGGRAEALTPLYVTLKFQALMSEIQHYSPGWKPATGAGGDTPLEVARSIGRRLAEDALAARVNGELVDLTLPLEADARLEILTTRTGSALHLPALRRPLAGRGGARVIPETKLGIGPPTDTGFFYDFYRDAPFTPEDWRRSRRRWRSWRGPTCPSSAGSRRSRKVLRATPRWAKS